MKNLLPAFRRLSTGKKLAVGIMLLLVVLTWLAVCLILASYLV